MKLEVHYHAFLREKLGQQTELLAFSDTLALNAGHVLDAFYYVHPEFARLSHALNIAINNELVSLDAPVCEGDRVDLLPPFGGG